MSAKQLGRECLWFIASILIGIVFIWFWYADGYVGAPFGARQAGAIIGGSWVGIALYGAGAIVRLAMWRLRRRRG